MATDEDLPRTSRREFLKRLGGALGGVALAQSPVFAGGGGRGSGGGFGAPPLPNGFRFYRVFTVSGDNPFPFAPLKAVLPAVMLTERDQILCHGINSGGARGVYALNMNYFTGGAPRVSGGVKLVEVGDTLPADGRPVHRIDVGDTNALGTYATVIGTANPGTEFAPGPSTPNPGLAQNNWVPQSAAPASTAPRNTASSVYIQKNPTSGLQPLVNLASSTPALDQSGAEGQFGGIHGDLALQDDNSVLLTAHYSLYNKTIGRLGVPVGPEAYQGLFQLTGGTASDVGRLVQSTGDLLPQSGAILTAMGLVDVSPDGYYVVQAHGAHRGRGGRGAGRDALAPSVLINGHVSQHPSQARLLAVSGDLRPRGNVTVGDTILGPRVGPGNVVGHVTHLTDSAHRLTVHHHSTCPTVIRTRRPSSCCPAWIPSARTAT